MCSEQVGTDRWCRENICTQARWLCPAKQLLLPDYMRSNSKAFRCLLYMVRVLIGKEWRVFFRPQEQTHTLETDWFFIDAFATKTFPACLKFGFHSLGFLSLYDLFVIVSWFSLTHAALCSLLLNVECHWNCKTLSYAYTLWLYTTAMQPKQSIYLTLN